MDKFFKLLVLNKVLIVHKQKLLILQRSKTAPTYPLFWDVPGGLIDIDDLNIKEAAIREVKEEANIVLDVNKLNLLTSIRFTRGENPAVCLVFKYDLEQLQDIQISYEHSAFKWIGYEDLNNLEMQPWLKEAIINEKLFQISSNLVQ